MIDSPAPVLTVTMRVQGAPLAVTLDPSTDGRRVTASAIAPTYLLGPYQLQVDAQAEGGLTAHTSWSFRVAPGRTADERTPPPATAAPGVAAPPAAPEAPPTPRAPAQPVNDATHRFFPETGYTVAGDFLTFWEQHGGLMIFGYPLTDAQPITDADWDRHGPDV